MPMHLIKYIKNYYDHFDETISELIPNENRNEYDELILYYYYGGSESIHFILEKMGISIPVKELLIFEEDLQRFKFLTKENQENIIIGKDLIELLNINLKDNDIIINEKYISKINDE